MRALRVALLAVIGAATTADALQAPGLPEDIGLNGYVEGRFIVEQDPDSPRQRPEGTLDLMLSANVRRWLRFHLETRGQIGGPPEGASGFGFFNLSDAFQNISPSVELEEAYADAWLPDLDLRIGKQKFAWGKLDTFNPTDVLNPRRFYDPFLDSDSQAKIGLPAVRAAYLFPPVERFLDEWSLTLVWVPVPVSFRFPEPAERWFPPTAQVPSSTQLLAPNLPPVRVENTLSTDNRSPPHQLEEGAVGLRLAGRSRRLDWSLCYYDGPETAPAFDLDLSAIAPLVRQALRRGEAPTVDDLMRIRVDSIMRPRFGRIRLVGGDAAFPLGEFTTRLEAAYGTDRLLPRTTSDLLSPANLSRALGPQAPALVASLLKGERVPLDVGNFSVARDVVEWGFGVDYTYRGWVPLVQLNQTFVLDNRTRLLISDVDTRVFVVVRKSFLGERLAIDPAVVQGFERGYTSVVLRATYSITDSLRVRAGYLLIAGSRDTLLGQFHDNDEGFFELRWSF